MKQYDFLVVGSGFAGSITAMALKQSGYDVCLVERERHPRFAIGESSTPIADMILRTIAEKYNLPKLKQISRYGTWQKNYPQVICGLKRGFSYYMHRQKEPFQPDAEHSRELLVAASENDENSDTNWLRSDVDHFLLKEARATGVECYEETEVQKVERVNENKVWNIHLKSFEVSETVQCSWIIDATGSTAFSNRFLGTSATTEGFHTHSSAIFSHFHNVPHWIDTLEELGAKSDDYPYLPDYSALHQVLEEGWMWMLRFNNGLLSAGIVLDGNDASYHAELSNELLWNKILQSYPSLSNLFENAVHAEMPGKFLETGRMQRKLNRIYGEGWISLPHSGGFVDPLHSTGIAFTLSGVEKILRLFEAGSISNDVQDGLQKYQDDFFKELFLIDMLVSSSYYARKSPKLFFASTMLYFIASVRYEQGRLGGETPETFLCAGETSIRAIIEESLSELKSWNQSGCDPESVKGIISSIRKRIAPFNNVGLMDPSAKNMYEHTAVVM